MLSEPLSESSSSVLKTVPLTKLEKIWFKKCEKKKLAIEKRKYLSEHKSHLIVASKFSSITLEQNSRVRGSGSVYSSICSLSRYGHDNLIVLEMNNTENRIAGLGIVRNKEKKSERNSLIYENEYYNGYIYRGLRIDRTEFSESEEELFVKLDVCCFRGHRHIKRGSYIVMFPYVHIQNLEKQGDFDLIMELRKMFQSRFSKPPPATIV